MTKEEFLAMSLPHKLKVYVKCNHKPDNSELETMVGIVDDCIITDTHEEDIAPLSISNYGLCLRPLSDLTKEIEHRGERFVPLHRLLENSYFDLSKMSEDEIMSFQNPFMMSELITLNDLPLYLEWHFDIADLISKGEAIDVNTLETNPYK